MYIYLSTFVNMHTNKFLFFYFLATPETLSTLSQHTASGGSLWGPLINSRVPHSPELVPSCVSARGRQRNFSALEE